MTTHISQLVSTGIKQLNPTDTNWYDNDYLYKELGGLVNDSFKPWYMKQFYRLGKERVLILAAQAKADGKEPAKLFSLLLKRA
jgi:hypothetical protein